MCSHVEELVRTVLEEMSLPPQKINQGTCRDFAMDVIRRENVVDVDLRVASGPLHYFIEAREQSGKRRYYDAECPEGVHRPDQLSFYQRRSLRDLEWICEGWIRTSQMMIEGDVGVGGASAYIGTPSFMSMYMGYDLRDLMNN